MKLKPLNFAILSLFLTTAEASADDVIKKLGDKYADYKAFKKPAIINALMTAKANGLLEESRYELDDKDELVVYFRAHEDGAAAINRFIKD